MHVFQSFGKLHFRLTFHAGVVRRCIAIVESNTMPIVWLHTAIHTAGVTRRHVLHIVLHDDSHPRHFQDNNSIWDDSIVNYIKDYLEKSRSIFGNDQRNHLCHLIQFLWLPSEGTELGNAAPVCFFNPGISGLSSLWWWWYSVDGLDVPLTQSRSSPL